MTPSLDATLFLVRLPIGVDPGDPSKYAIFSDGANWLASEDHLIEFAFLTKQNL